MDLAVRGDIFASFEHLVGTAVIAHEAPGLTHEQHARGRIPQVQLVLPETVHPTVSNPGEIEGGGAKPPNACHVRSDRGVDLRPFLRTTAPEKRDTRADHAVSKVTTRRNAKAGVLQPGAPALLRPITVIGERVIDEALRNFGYASGLSFLNGDRDREMRDAVEKVVGSVERVDDPPRLLGIALDLPAFLKQHAPVRPRIAQFLDDGLLGPLVGHGNEVRRALPTDLQLLDLAEVASKARSRLASGALHDGDQAGVCYHGLVRAADIFPVVDVDDNLRA